MNRPYLTYTISQYEHDIEYNAFNPGQIPVNTADQPIFTLKKRLMIWFPDKFGPYKYLFILVPSHWDITVDH